MQLADWLAYIKKSHSQEIDLGLARVFKIAQRLAVLSFKCPVITVAGTNGKGSCVEFLQEIYTAAGYRVGSFTSPYLLSFNEQIKVNNQPYDEATIIAAFEHIEENRGDISLTLFEFTTLAALIIFQHACLDIIILEVGMGGRDDAVNIIDADVAIVTNVALDHMTWLGDDREAIAYQKAGIYRQDAFAIYGEANIPQSLLAYIKQLDINLLQLTVDFHYTIEAQGWRWFYQQQDQLDLLPPVHLDPSNAAIALMAIKLLQQRLPVSVAAIKKGLMQANLPARWQVIEEGTLLILDVAHNLAACQNLQRKIQYHYPHHSINALVGMLADKDIESCLDCFTDIIDKWYVASLSVSRGEHFSRLYKHLQASNIKQVQTFASVKQAYAQARQDNQEILLVFGSFHTVAEVLQARECEYV